MRDVLALDAVGRAAGADVRQTASALAMRLACTLLHKRSNRRAGQT
jgi:hypothetical protein